MSLRRKFATLPVIVLVLLSMAQIASAGIRDGLTFTLSCGGFTSDGGSLILDRNTSSTNREMIVISATDGSGNVIFAPSMDSFLVGARMSLPEGTFFRWTSAPEANPLTLTVISPAGNNLQEQIIYQTSANCATLASVTGDVRVADGVTSPSVPLNSAPPRAVNPANVVATQDGYAVVNTDNLNIRSGDSPSYTVVGIVDGGTRLIVLGRNANRSWWYVQAGDIRGWVNAVHLVLRGDLTNVPVVRAVGEMIPPTLFVYADQPLRSAPLDSAGVLCVIAGNQEYVIVGRNANRTFYQIEAVCNGVPTTGWMPLEVGALRNPAQLSAPVTG